MALLANDAFFYSSINNSSSINASAVDFSSLGLTTNRVVGYLEPFLTTTITTDGLTEGKSSLYYTDTRSRAAMSAGLNITYNSTSGSMSLVTNPILAGLTLTGLTGVIKATAGILSGSSTTTDLPEGSNLYYTNARARLTLSSGIGISYNSTSGTITNSGVVGLVGGSGITVTAGLDGSYTISNYGVNSITGTANQIIVTGSTSITLSTPQDIATSSTVQFAGLTLGSLNGVLKANSGIISGSSTTDDLPEGKTNVYFTIPRARSAFIAISPMVVTSGIIYLGYSTSNFKLTGVDLDTIQNISTTSSPQFARLLNSSIGSTNLLLGSSTGANLTTGGGCIFIGQGSGNCVTSGTFNIGIGASTYGGGGTMTQSSAQNIAIGNNALFSATTTANNNIACGYQALQTLTDGNNNSAFGYQAGQAVVGGIRNTLIGNSAGYSLTNGSYNTLVGASPCFILTTGSFNTSLGYLAGQSLITGQYNLHLGYNTQASSSSVSNEMVIASNTTITTGRGANTCFINATAGLYYTNVATAYLVGYAFSSGRVQWQNNNANNPIAGFTIGNVNGYGANTTVIPSKMGIYEITVSGTVVGSGGSIFMTLDDINVVNYNTFLQSFSTLGIAYQIGFTATHRPWTNLSLAGFEVNITGATYYVGLPLYMSIKFIGL